MMNVMLIGYNAPNNLWVKLCLQHVFCKNRIPHKKIGKTPYKLWKSYQPNLKYLKV